jgi:hypothetical protein
MKSSLNAYPGYLPHPGRVSGYVQYNPHSKSRSVRHDFLKSQPIDVSEIPLEQSNQRLERGLQAVDKRVRTLTQPTPDRAIKRVVSDLIRSLSVLWLLPPSGAVSCLISTANRNKKHGHSRV